jgi:hypothetical protein
VRNDPTGGWFTLLFKFIDVILLVLLFTLVFLALPWAFRFYRAYWGWVLP